MNGHPPAGAIVPSVASGELAPKVIAHELEPVADSVHRPARFTGGGLAAGPAGTLLAEGGLSEPPNIARSLPLQAASNVAQTIAGRAARRTAMVWRLAKMNGTMVSRVLPSCQDARFFERAVPPRVVGAWDLKTA